MAGSVDGFAASSLFEARLAREVAGETGSVYLTSPGLRPMEAAKLGRLCDHVVFNSLEQYARLRTELPRTTALGIRVNPELPFVEDDRYNPCCQFSKLGVPIDRLARAAKRKQALARISGLHFHTNCEGQSYRPLLETVDRVIDRLDDLLHKLEWVNLGGGYSLEPADGLDPLVEAVRRLRERYALTVSIEPGAALVRRAGFIVATVIDLFRNAGKRIAVLDTTVNHMPEVFEYQFEPDILGDHAEGEHEFLLAGGTCLAGDLFGEYGFDEPIRVGDRVIFPDAGAYTLVKSHMFNGINLPTVYAVSEDGELGPGHQLDYRDYLRRCGVESDAAL
jgi:carboxynorspermidine decarboxylase